MTIGAALIVIVAGLLISAFLHAPTIGLIVVIVGVVGLILAALGTRGRARV
jgi:hypothetical protein